MKTGNFNLNLFCYTAEIHLNSASKLPAKLCLLSPVTWYYVEISLLFLTGFLKRLLILFMCEFYLCVCMWTMCMTGVYRVQKRALDPWYWSYDCLWTIFAKVTHSFTCLDISLAPFTEPFWRREDCVWEKGSKIGAVGLSVLLVLCSLLIVVIITKSLTGSDVSEDLF